MKRFCKTLTITLIAAVLMIGFPGIFSGAILGCGGDKENSQQPNADNRSTSAADEKKVEKTSAYKVIFVELGSLNCIPCRMMQPVMQEVDKKFAGQVKVVYHDVMTESGRAEGFRYAIRVIPTQVFLDKDGKEYFRHEGFFPFEEIEKVLRGKGVN